MINLTDVTFNIPIRIDTQDRVRNLRTTLSFLCRHFDTNILVYEESAKSEVPEYLNGLPIKYTYKHFPTNSPLMRRTFLLNEMAKDSKTPIIVNYDADVLLKLQQYKDATEAIRQNKIDMIYPYNGKFMDIFDKVLDVVITTLNVENLQMTDGNCIHPNSLGGAIFWNKQKFIEFGMENQNFISWGFEDNERLVRAQKFGLRIGRIDGPCWHMHHASSTNSANTSHQAYFDNQQEFHKVSSMNPVQIKEYIKTWNWVPR